MTQQSAFTMESLRHALTWDQFKYRAKQHTLRVALDGRNTAMHPWRLPPLTPELRGYVSESAYNRVAERFNRAAEWRLWEPIVLELLWLVPPLAMLFLRRRQRVRRSRVRALMMALSRDPQVGLWRSVYSRVWEAHRLDVGCDQDFTAGWVDIFGNVSAPLLEASGGGGGGGGGGAGSLQQAGGGVGGFQGSAATSFDLLLSRGAGGGASSITFEALGAAGPPPMEFSGGSRRGSCELLAGSTRSSASIGQPMTSSYSSFMPIPGAGGGGARRDPAGRVAGGRHPRDGAGRQGRGRRVHRQGE